MESSIKQLKQKLAEQISKNKQLINKQKEEIVILKTAIEKLPVNIYWKNNEGIYEAGNDFLLNLTTQKIREQTNTSGYEIASTNCKNKHHLTQEVPLLNDQQQVQGIVGISLDVTQLKRLELELKQTWDQAEFVLNNIVANMPGHVYWKDKKGVYLGCNNLQAESLGLKSGSEVIGKTDFDLPWAKQSAELFRENDKRIMKKGITQVVEERVEIDGKEGIVLSHKTPLRNNQDRVVGILGISIDITKRKAAERALKKAKDIAEAANQAKSKFIANISHDIRTPLNGVIGIADILKREGTTPKDKEYGQIIFSSAQILYNLLNDILDIIQLDDLKEEKNRQDKINIHEIIKNLTELITPNIQAKNLKFEIKIDKNIPQHIISDRVKLERILLNIIGNAIKFTENGKISLEATSATSTNNEQMLILKISDTGIGIPKESLTKIFDLFYRVSPSYEGNYQGHGIGLYTAKRYVKTLKGSLKVESEIDKGTTFYVELPALSSSDNETKDNRREEHNIINNTAQPESALQKVKTKKYANKILLIEDDALAQRMAKYHLEKANIEVQVASNAEMAFKMIKSFPFDLIISDIGLPGLSGNEFTVLLRYWEKISHKTPMPVIGLSAHSSPQVKDDAIFSGMDLVLTKPINDRNLQEIFNFLPIHTNTTPKKETKPDSNPGFNMDKEQLLNLDKYALFDEQEALNKFDQNQDILNELLKLLLTETLPDELVALKQAHKEKSWDTIEKLAHKIKGAALYCGTPRLRFASGNLEKYAQAGNTILLEELYQQLLIVMEETRQRVAVYLKG